MEKKETKDNTEEKPLAENGDDKAENNHLPLPPEINNNAEDTVVHIIDHPKPSKFKEYFDALICGACCFNSENYFHRSLQDSYRFYGKHTAYR